jgi:hypothetical protein
MRKTPPPIHSTPAAHPLHHPSYRCRRLSVDCCVLGTVPDTVDANGVFVVVVGDVAVFALLVVVVFVAFSLPSRSPNVLTRSRGLSHPPSVTPACFWLVAACKILNGGHLRPSSYFITVIFFVVQFAAPKKENHPPHTLHPGLTSSPSSFLSLPPTIG